MTVYHLSTSLDAISAGVDWSETKERRLSGSGMGKDFWYCTDADRAPLGQLPAEIRNEIDAHWALSFARNDNLPDTFMSLKSAHFTGAPFARQGVCEVFQHFAEGNCEIIPIRNFWSLHDNKEVPVPYFVANVFNTAALLDNRLTKTRPVKNPRFGNMRFLPPCLGEKIFVRKDHFSDRHLLRDAETSEWFCDDVFREAIEAVTPGTYEFRQVNLV